MPDQTTLAIQNNPCGTCRAMGKPMPCPGHDSGGGGDDSSGDDEKNNPANKENLLAPTKTEYEPNPKEEDENHNNELWVKFELLSDKSIEYPAGLFSIQSDRLGGNLVLQMLPGLSKQEQETAQKFLQTLKKEFEGFKNQLAKQGVPVSNFKADLQNGRLSIHIPIPTHYDAFIKRLESKNLLPLPNAKWHEKQEQEQQKERAPHTAPTPYGNISKGPRPSGWKS